MSDAFSGVRKEYQRDILDEESAGVEPFALFGRWLDEALAANLIEPNAMTLATADASGNPSARVVLLKQWDQHGLVFFTNYQSAKGQALQARAAAALAFYWSELERQIRIEGNIEKTEREISEKYFALRPRGSQISAYASAQSRPAASRAELEQQRAEIEGRFAGISIPCPQHWGGYRLSPRRFEFWQGRADKFHDRIVFELTGNSWQRSRLAPEHSCCP